MKQNINPFSIFCLNITRQNIFYQKYFLTNNFLIFFLSKKFLVQMILVILLNEDICVAKYLSKNIAWKNILNIIATKIISVKSFLPTIHFPPNFFNPNLNTFKLFFAKYVSQKYFLPNYLFLIIFHFLLFT